MKATGVAQSAGRQVASSRWLQVLARGGFVACGVNYMLIGLLAVQIAVGAGGEAADAAGAMHAVAGHPGGSVVLWLLAVGFVGLVVWRLAEALYGQASPDGHTAGKRLASLGRAVLYVFLCIGLVSFLLGTAAQGSGDSHSKDATAQVMGYAGGRWLILLIGLSIAAVGIGMIVVGVRKTFIKNLHVTQMSQRTRKVVNVLGVVGSTARGAVFGVLGGFLVVAAATFDSKQATGLDGALRKFTLTPLGPWLLVIVALGLVTFGVFSCFEARWRKIQPG